MKKLMIACAAVAIAAGVQAASINWQVVANPGSKLTDASGTAVYKQALYLVDGSDTSIAAIKAILDDNKTTGFSYWEEATTANVNAGNIVAHDLTKDTMTTDKQKFAVLLIDTNVTDADFAYKFSTAMEVTPSGDPRSPTQFTFSVPGGDFSGGWTKVSAVPEPTSGLLLLLGVAGLALKRRRA